MPIKMRSYCRGDMDSGSTSPSLPREFDDVVAEKERGQLVLSLDAYKDSFLTCLSVFSSTQHSVKLGRYHGS